MAERARTSVSVRRVQASPHSQVGSVHADWVWLSREQKEMTIDKRVRPAERCVDGECAVCGRRHIHKDDCATLKRRVAEEEKR